MVEYEDDFTHGTPSILPSDLKSKSLSEKRKFLKSALSELSDQDKTAEFIDDYLDLLHPGK